MSAGTPEVIPDCRPAGGRHDWAEIRTGMFAGWSKCSRCFRKVSTAAVNAARATGER